MDGWAGNILRVDLSSGEHMIEDMDPDFARDYIGAQGTATKILFDEVDPEIDALSPENKLIFSTGALTGTGAVSAARAIWGAKSPLTGSIGFANCGGYFPAEVKYAGYDMIIFEGKADDPVYLWIEDDEVEIRDAQDLWGKTVFETEDLIKAEIEDPWIAMDTRIACIGPAGENLLKSAAIMNDKHRAAARGGIGAVMGSKNLKAVAVRGTKGLTIANPDEFRKAVDGSLETVRASEVASNAFPNYGSPGLMDLYNEMGMVPHYNFQKMALPEAHQISGQALSDQYLIRNMGCFACPLSCGGPTEVKDGPFQCAGHRPEYETHALLAASCGMYDSAALIKANDLCNELGIDTMDMGGAIACAMELYEKGFLPEEDAGDKLNFGNAEAIIKLIEQTARREGLLGELMAEGGMALAEKYGHPELFLEVKKMAFSGYDVRNVHGLGLAVATSTRGACHCRGYTIFAEVLAEFLGQPEMKMDPVSSDGKAGLVKGLQDTTASFVDAAGFCLFSLMGQDPPVMFAQLEAATGAGYTFEELMKNGERIWNMQRLFNIKAGLTRADDYLPKRLLEEPATAGPGTGKPVENFDAMLTEYYQIRGWDGNGVPSDEKLAELGLK